MWFLGIILLLSPVMKWYHGAVSTAAARELLGAIHALREELGPKPQLDVLHIHTSR